MTPGPTLIVKPPGCKTPVKIRTLNSGNTFGAVYWTDTKCEAPMMPDNPWLKKHPAEEALFWTDECEKIGSLPSFGKLDQKDPWEGLAFAEEPSEQDYFNSLESGIANSEKKLCYVRRRLWWAGNDDVRLSGAASLSTAHLDNLACLVACYAGDSPQQRLIKMEILRERGLFEDALALLDCGGFEALEENAKFIASLCHAGDHRVAKFPW